ncbi:MAG: DNA-binding response regulator [Bacteroidetes bacterium]|nr:MAG: DNA-binding response regulator [Bacteroidota bacterium]
MIYVGIVEDKTELGKELQSKIELSGDFSVRFIAKNGKEALSHFKNYEVDILLMDIEMPIMNGIEATKEIINLRPDFPVVMCSIYDDEESIKDSILAGATGYLLKDETPASIHQAIHQALNGGSPLNPKIARKTLRLLNAQAPKINLNERYGLTSRELEILELLATGKTYQQIADSLFLSQGTIRKHIENLYRKLDVNNKVDAVSKLSR